MKVEYKLSEKDLLTHYLYFTNNSPAQRGQKRVTRILIPMIYIVLAWILFAVGMRTATMILFVAAALWYFFWPIYYRHREIKTFKKHIKETADDLIEQSQKAETLKNHLLVQSRISESKYQYSQIEEVKEHKNLTYVFLAKGHTLVLPHEALGKDTVDEFVTDIKKRM